MKEYFPEKVKPGMVSPLDSEKFQYILEQQKKYCCKINSKNDKIGTGFFCKIILPNSLKILPVLMTCNHVLDEEDIKIEKVINFSLDNEKNKYKIKIDNERLVYTNNKMDFTIIQIRESDNLDVNLFISIDDEILKEKPKNNFIENSICLLHYQNGERAKISFGTIKGISEDKWDILHNCGSETGSSGGPLINFLNLKLIGIHKGYKEIKSLNIGICIKPVIEEFFNNIELKKLNIQDNYENVNNNDKDNKSKDKKVVKVNEKSIKNFIKIKKNYIYFLFIIANFFKEFLKSYTISFLCSKYTYLIVSFMTFKIIFKFSNESNKMQLLICFIFYYRNSLIKALDFF